MSLSCQPTTSTVHHCDKASGFLGYMQAGQKFSYLKMPPGDLLGKPHTYIHAACCPSCSTWWRPALWARGSTVWLVLRLWTSRTAWWMWPPLAQPAPPTQVCAAQFAFCFSCFVFMHAILASDSAVSALRVDTGALWKVQADFRCCDC